MVNQGAVPPIDLLNAKVAAEDALAERNTLVSRFALERSDEISALVADLARLEAQISQSRDQLERSDLVSPVDGVVNKVLTTTLGGVIQPGEEIFEIIPRGDELLVEVRIQPKDIAFIRTGMRTNVKLTAYDYTVYGSLNGRIDQVSADTFEDPASVEQGPYYKVRVALEPDKLRDDQGVIELRPGMQAEAEVHVGEKTVMQYLITPLVKSQEALREP